MQLNWLQNPMHYIGIIGLSSVCLCFSNNLLAADASKTTSSHVFQKTEQLILEIEVLRNTIGLTDIPVEPEPQKGKLPVHVYSKSLEVLEKVSRAQRKLGMVPAEVGEIPLKKITPADVSELTDTILFEIQKMKEQLAIDAKIEEVAFVGAKTPSHVYENMWRASYMIDGLTGQLNPNDTYRSIQYIQDELELIATRLGTDLALEPDPVKGRKRPKDSAQQGLLALYKIAALQRRLGMDSLGVPSFTLVRISPSDVYDIANMLMAEVMRIKIHLEIPLPRGSRPVPNGKSPKDVYGAMKLVVDNLNRIVKAAAKQKK